MHQSELSVSGRSESESLPDNASRMPWAAVLISPDLRLSSLALDMSASTPQRPPLDLSDVWMPDVDVPADVFSPTTDMYATSTSAPTTASSPSLHANSDDNDDRHAASIELRRQRNRESMRRTRLRAKETLTELRATVARLEAQYARLLVAPDAVDAQFVERLQARLLALVQMRRTLESENGAVQAQIQQRQSLEQELQQILNDNALDELVNEKLSLLGEPAAAVHRDQYTPLTPPQARGLVRTFCHELARVQAASRNATTPEPAVEVFGWRTKRHVDTTTNEMHFEFAKRFDHIAASDMVQRAWYNAMDLAAYRATERELDIRRLDFLQHISTDCKVVVREIVHPVDAIVFCTHYLCFRMPHPSGADGFLIAMRSVNPPSAADETQRQEEGENGAKETQSERVVWIDVSVSIELLACGPHSCEIRWGGRTNYHSPQYAAENAVKFLMGLLRWEQRLIGPLIQLY